MKLQNDFILQNSKNMKKSKSAFSLIEVIIASIILSITVFWVYKLIWENSKLINNSEEYSFNFTIFRNFEECLKNIWFTAIDSRGFPYENKLNFWPEWKSCVEWSWNQVKINNKIYILNRKILSKTSEKINLELSIFWETFSTMKEEFILYK